MEKTGKPLTREALIAMQVIDAKGHLVGKVKDIAFTVGKTGICLTVETASGEIQHTPWEDVQAASDFILLKAIPESAGQMQMTPVQTASSSMPEKTSMSNQTLQQSAKATAFTEEEKVFGAYEAEQKPAQTEVKEEATQPLCSTCNQPLTWVPQYKRWYCYTDKKYAAVTEKQAAQQKLCPTCNQPLTWIPQYKRWYCYTDKKYA